MSIESISPTTATYPTPGGSPKQEMDGEAFRLLLLAQLRNQDPSAPMDTTDMMNQTVQLAMMEQITAQTTAAQENFALQMRLAATQMVGHEVSYIDAEGNEVTGTATGVELAQAVPLVIVDGEQAPLDRIAAINPSTATNDPAPEDSGTETNEPS